MPTASREREKKESGKQLSIICKEGKELYENTVLENEPKFNKEELGHTQSSTVYTVLASYREKKDCFWS